MKPARALLFLTTVCNTFAGDAKTPVASNGDWELSISAGPALRQSGLLSFSGGSRSAGFTLPSFVGSASLTRPPVGSTDEYGRRIYNDGYVRKDFGTDGDGLTTNWGYGNLSQASGDNLSFHATGAMSVRNDTLVSGPADSFSRHEQTIAPMIRFEALHKQTVFGWRPGFSASLLWSPVSADQNWSDYSVTQRRDDYRLDYTDVYNLGGVGAFLPPAPYAGNAFTPGFTLENLPDSRRIDEVLIGSESAGISNNVSSRFRADHTTLSFGPTFEKRIDSEWAFQGGFGLSLHWIHWSAEQNERLTVNRGGGKRLVRAWRDSESGNRFLPGVYLQASAEWKPKVTKWSILGLLRGDVGMRFSESIGPSEIHYAPEGITAALLFSHPL